MQSKGGVLLFLAMLALPVIAISTNHNIFFGVTAAIITVVSFRYFYNLIMKNDLQGQESDEELEEELEELIDIDVKRFGIGLAVVYNLIVILFLIYCAFYMDTVVLKGITAFAISLQVFFIIRKGRLQQNFSMDHHKPQIILSSLSNITVILFTALNKIAGMG